MKQYVKPVLDCEMFSANEFIAACYKIKCNVPDGFGYIEKNGKPGYQASNWHNPNGDELLAEGKGCGVYHVGVHLDTAPTENAMWQPTGFLGRPLGDPYGVFHWSTGEGNTEQHFSKVKDTQWETNPNAS